MVNKMKKYGILLSALLVSMALQAAKPVKNVIFMIGDGMGLNQAYAAAMAQNAPLVMMSQADAIALQETWSANRKITDSAASGSALACGQKTNNGMIGMTTDSVPMYSILVDAQRNGKATGIVVTCDLCHATPASFYAHTEKRGNMDVISREMLDYAPNIMIGGGRRHLSGRADSLDLASALKEQGKQLFNSFEDLQQSSVLRQRNPSEQASFLAFCAEEHLPAKLEGRGDYLPQAVALAIDYLSQDKDGFVLMVEGSAIDFRCHASDVQGVIAETLDFDKAVQVAVDFARKQKNTLVVVTADHETGGLSVLQDKVYQQGENFKHRFNTSGHTGVAVPVYLFGAGVDAYPPFLQNSDHKAIMSSLMKLK